VGGSSLLVKTGGWNASGFCLCLYTSAVPETTYELEGRVAVVTGASRGIGFAIAEALASHGCSVVITSRHVGSVEEAATKLAVYDARVVPYECDIRNELAVQRLFTFVGDEFGHLDFLVNNAGIYGPARPISEVDPAGWRDTVDTNITGPFLCTRYGLPLMKHGGVIVNNISIAAYQAFPNAAAYMASKHGALGLTNATREDVRKVGIRVMALVPGATDTEIWNQFWPDAPRQKMVQPKEVAMAVVSALMMPAGTSVDEIRIMPTGGAL
jgi:NAD(P)-dependent dehydrogenase (short-subunit alcohol dehydrogenase family)